MECRGRRSARRGPDRLDGVVVPARLGAAIVVVLNIPLALLGSVIALWLTGQTINLMTLGGLAGSVGILVDEATVEVENIHTQMDRTGSIAAPSAW